MRLRFRKTYLVLILILGFLLAGILYFKAQYVIPVLMYHNIDENSKTSSLSVSPENFRRQMIFFKKHKYNVVKLEEIPALLRQNKILPKTVAITFDDGYMNNYQYAFSILKELRIPATIFVIPALVGVDGYLSWQEIIEMSESGIISIGSHTMTHPWLKDLPEPKLISELADSKRSIESHIRKEAYSFSYPLGGFNENIRENVIKAGYKAAVATNPGRKYPKHDVFAMKRLRISKTSDNLFVFWIEVSGFYTWIKEHRDKD